MQINIWKKGFVCGIIVLFIGTSVVSSIVRSDNEIILVKNIQPIKIGGYRAQSSYEIGSLIVDSWWNINWMYRKQITINHTQVAGNLVNFPVLFITTMDASKVQNDGDDIVFTDNDGIKLNHEIELYDGSTGELIAWVNITRLSSTTNTQIWMYYGNPGSGSQQNKYGTWNSNYKAVYHLDETSPPYVDSTSNKNNITTADVNGSGMAQSGGIYKWQHFNGTSNRFVIPFSVSGAYTLEAIANTDSVASSEVLMGYGLTTSSPYPGVAMGISAVSNALFIGNSNSQKALSPTATYVTTKTSHWWSDVYGSNISLLFYLDGINYTSSLSDMNFFNDAAGYYTIGARYYLNNYSLFWKGCIDEVRISSGTWNASWINTCYSNQKDPASFFNLGSQEQVPSGNKPPVFGTPTPANVSANTPLSLTWSIPINDREGNSFSWTIQCNGQTSSATGAANGTKTLALSGLAYSTTYKVWVNATDPTGSGNYTRKWYTFTTKVNSPPVFGTPSPVNSSINNPLSLTWSIPISDPEGNTFYWTIQCNGQTNSASGASNGTKSLSLSGLAYSTTYKVWVNATDPTPAGSGLYTRRWFTFTTQASVVGNNPPVFGTPNPVNESNNNPLSLSWSIPINDAEADLFSWTIQCSNGQGNSGTNAPNGNKSLALSGLAYSTTYKVWVNATDLKPIGSGLYSRRWYTFTTKTNLVNNPPVFSTPSPANGSTGNLLSLTWSIPITDQEGNTFTWTIQCSNRQVNSSNGALNGTKSLALSGLANSTSYKVWVNATDPAGSGLYTRRWFTFTTKGNNPPMFGTPSPTNGSTGNLLSLSWSIPISDLNSDSFNWVIQCSNGQSASANGASNGTKSLSLSGLANSTTYKVWVNATDPTGSGLYTRKWYTFTTQQQNLPPNKPNQPSGNNSGKIKIVYTYTTSTTDPNGDQVYYLWDWGDGNYSGWLGPYNSGVTISTTHKWTVKGSYSIKVKAKDIYGKESAWSDPLPITMPYSYKPILQFLELLFQEFPNAFPILRQLLGY